MSEESAEQAIEAIYENNDGNPVIEDFAQRNGIESLMILTITSQQAAEREVEKIVRAVRGKRVVEVGAGVGFLALEIAKHAKSVIAIEADVSWSWVFAAHLYAFKPPNLTWVFGAAESVSEYVRGDVAIIYTRSDIEGMTVVAKKMCPLVIVGPRLSLKERYPDASDEDVALAEKFAATITMDDLVSRHGASGTKIKSFNETGCR